MIAIDENIETIKNIVQKTDLKHIAIIMDGNRRWAKEHCLPSAMGHKKGVDSLKNVVILERNGDTIHWHILKNNKIHYNRKQHNIQPPALPHLGQGLLTGTPVHILALSLSFFHSSPP